MSGAASQGKPQQEGFALRTSVYTSTSPTPATELPSSVKLREQQEFQYHQMLMQNKAAALFNNHIYDPAHKKHRRLKRDLTKLYIEKTAPISVDNMDE